MGLRLRGLRDRRGAHAAVAWWLNDELDTGTSGKAETFGNGCLASAERFKALNVEVWALGAAAIERESEWYAHGSLRDS